MIIEQHEALEEGYLDGPIVDSGSQHALKTTYMISITIDDDDDIDVDEAS